MGVPLALPALGVPTVAGVLPLAGVVGRLAGTEFISDIEGPQRLPGRGCVDAMDATGCRCGGPVMALCTGIAVAAFTFAASIGTTEGADATVLTFGAANVGADDDEAACIVTSAGALKGTADTEGRALPCGAASVGTDVDETALGARSD